MIIMALDSGDVELNFLKQVLYLEEGRLVLFARFDIAFLLLSSVNS